MVGGPSESRILPDFADYADFGVFCASSAFSSVLGFTRSVCDRECMDGTAGFHELRGFGGIRSTQPTSTTYQSEEVLQVRRPVRSGENANRQWVQGKLETP